MTFTRSITRFPITRLLGLTLLTSISFPGNAANTSEFSDYVVHYNALPTIVLLPEVARAYKIKRSKNRGMVNIVVQHQTDTGTKGITAKVTGTGSNLNGQLKHLKFNELKDGDVTYYIADFRVTHKEFIHFKIMVQPKGSDRAHEVKFEKEFYTR